MRKGKCAAFYRKIEKIESFDSKLDRELADSVLEVTVNANWKIVEELRGDERMCQALLEIMEPEINKIKEELTKDVSERVAKDVSERVTKDVSEKVTKRERQKGIKNAVVALRVCGQEDTAIKNAIMEAYGISASEAEEYL